MSALEDDARVAARVDETTDAAAQAAWTPPSHLGAMPERLRERAEQLLAAQDESIRALEEMHREAGRHLAAVRTVPSESADRSVYLDVTG